MTTILGSAAVDALLDEIKDAVDDLSQIANPARRIEAARDVIEYIELHFIDAARYELEAKRSAKRETRRATATTPRRR